MDVEWYVGEVVRMGRRYDVGACQEGSEKLRRWKEDGCRHKLLHRAEMMWFLRITIWPKELRKPREMVMHFSGKEAPEGHVVCEEVMEDGTICGFVGRPADVGVHKF